MIASSQPIPYRSSVHQPHSQCCICHSSEGNTIDFCTHLWYKRNTMTFCFTTVLCLNRTLPPTYFHCLQVQSCLWRGKYKSYCILIYYTILMLDVRLLGYFKALGPQESHMESGPSNMEPGPTVNPIPKLTLALVDSDSTIVYYTVHNGIQPPTNISESKT